MLVGKTVGPFTVETELGSGAMGTVYKAHNTKTGQYVAIKVVLQGLGNNESMLARFEREVAVLKQLNHPNIVRLLACGKYKGAPFYAMEYIEGEPLDRILKRRGKLPWEEVIALGTQLCAALHHAHEQGIVHRDLKPANLLLTTDGTLKLTDFGIAKDLDLTQLTATNSTVGTASYMSPEQCQGLKFITRKSDLYALGVLFYEMLTGRHPFQADTLMDMFLQHVQGKFPRPSRINLDIPIWLDALVCQLLEKKPDDRPYDAERVARDLASVKEKVADQQSAGAETARARVMDRPLGDTKLGKKDKELARSLLGQGKRKRPASPFYERVWFQTLGISAILGGLVFALYLGFQPASPDKLYQEAQKLMASKDPNDWDKARDGPIKAYLDQKKGAADPQTKQVQDWADRVDLQLRERQLHKRFRNGIPAEGDAEPEAMNALRAEDNGDLDSALRRWRSLRKYKADPDQRSWGLLAEKNVRTVQEAEQRYGRIHDLLETAQAEKRDVKPDDDMDDLVVDALRYEASGNKTAALEKWKRMRDKYEKEYDQRLWYLLAVKKIRELNAKQ
jgi:serine/threonine-protein kinase